MEHKQVIICPYCKSSDLQKNGRRPSGIQYWRCKKCRKNFQLEYRYNACKQGVKEQITELTLNGSGIRDTGRVLRINKNTVISELKKNVQSESIFFGKS